MQIQAFLAMPSRIEVDVGARMKRIPKRGRQLKPRLDQEMLAARLAEENEKHGKRETAFEQVKFETGVPREHLRDARAKNRRK